jgi:hypothetical protein
MRFGFMAAAVAVCLSSAVYAQAWSEYLNREEFFTVNFPGDPKVTEVAYKTGKGTALKAKVFTATAPAGSITARRRASFQPPSRTRRNSTVPRAHRHTTSRAMWTASKPSAKPSRRQT